MVSSGPGIRHTHHSCIHHHPPQAGLQLQLQGCDKAVGANLYPYTAPPHNSWFTPSPLAPPPLLHCLPAAAQFLDPYTFPSAHQRLLEPYNYFAFGQRYVGTLIDFANSFLGQEQIWAKVGVDCWL